ncbi:MAG: cytochrome c family protein [Pseudomonadota bacterium]
MDSFELNKIAGALLGTLTLTIGLGIVSEILFAPEAPAKPGYEIAVPEGPAGGNVTEAKAPVIPIEQLFATASIEKGANVAKRCGSCHNFTEGAGAKVGPDLYGVVDRPVASVAGFAYSAAMKAKGGEWTPQALNHFLTSPKADVPGTAMAFAGIPKETERADLIAYLNSLSHSPKPLPTAAAAPADAKPAEAAPAPADAAKPAETAPADTKPAETKPAQ